MINCGNRIKEIRESVTLKLNAKAVSLADEGKLIYNLTAGQLPFRPMPEFIENIRQELNFIKSYQYSPVAGIPELRSKVLEYFEKSREVSVPKSFGCIISNGAKHSLTNILASILNNNDEVILLSPYWVSYPYMVKLYGGVPLVVSSNIYDQFTPGLGDIERLISERTKAIIINSPNNPVGMHYKTGWMQDFGKMMKKFEHINIISDEIYYELSYYDPKPTYFYQFYPELLERTIIVDGISKVLASTGLRIGYCMADNELIKGMTRLQGQTASGANSLVQRALLNFEFDKIQEFLIPVKNHLRKNSKIIRENFRQANLSHEWYQSTSAFYYMVDFSRTKIMEKFKTSENNVEDYSSDICNFLLNEYGLALVPSTDFGHPNSARLSLVLEEGPFTEAMFKLTSALNSP